MKVDETKSNKLKFGSKTVTSRDIGFNMSGSRGKGSDDTFMPIGR